MQQVSLKHWNIDSSLNVMSHGDAWEVKWRGNWRREWVARTLHTTSEHGVSSITTADAHSSAASSRLYWCPRRFKWTPPFRRKTNSGFCSCAITFQAQSTARHVQSWLNVSNQSRNAGRENGIDLCWPLPACAIDKFSALNRFSSHTWT